MNDNRTNLEVIAPSIEEPLAQGLSELGLTENDVDIEVLAPMAPTLAGGRIIMGDDSIVKGSVSEGGAVWSVFNAGARMLEFWVSYGPMFFPSFKEWRRGRECLDELAVQRAFRGDNPYDKTPEEINARVAALLGVDRVCYNTPTNVREVIGPGSYQALDASYPVSERFWPSWLKEEVEHYRHYRCDVGGAPSSVSKRPAGVGDPRAILLRALMSRRAFDCPHNASGV